MNDEALAQIGVDPGSPPPTVTLRAASPLNIRNVEASELVLRIGHRVIRAADALNDQDVEVAALDAVLQLVMGVPLDTVVCAFPVLHVLRAQLLEFAGLLKLLIDDVPRHA